MATKSKGVGILTTTTQIINNGTADAASFTDNTASLYTAGGLAVAKNIYAKNLSGGATGVFTVVTSVGLSTITIQKNILSSQVGMGFTGAIRFNARVDANPFSITFTAPALFVGNYANTTSVEGTAVGTTSDGGVFATDFLFCRVDSVTGTPNFTMSVIPLQSFTTGLYFHTFGINLNGIIP